MKFDEKDCYLNYNSGQIGNRTILSELSGISSTSSERLTFRKDADGKQSLLFNNGNSDGIRKYNTIHRILWNGWGSGTTYYPAVTIGMASPYVEKANRTFVVDDLDDSLSMVYKNIPCITTGPGKYVTAKDEIIGGITSIEIIYSNFEPLDLNTTTDPSKLYCLFCDVNSSEMNITLNQNVYQFDWEGYDRCGEHIFKDYKNPVEQERADNLHAQGMRKILIKWSHVNATGGTYRGFPRNADYEFTSASNYLRRATRRIRIGANRHGERAFPGKIHYAKVTFDEGDVLEWTFSEKTGLLALDSGHRLDGKCHDGVLSAEGMHSVSDYGRAYPIERGYVKYISNDTQELLYATNSSLATTRPEPIPGYTKLTSYLGNYIANGYPITLAPFAKLIIPTNIIVYLHNTKYILDLDGMYLGSPVYRFGLLVVKASPLYSGGGAVVGKKWKITYDAHTSVDMGSMIPIDQVLPTNRILTPNFYGASNYIRFPSNIWNVTNSTEVSMADILELDADAIGGLRVDTKMIGGSNYINEIEMATELNIPTKQVVDTRFNVNGFSVIGKFTFDEAIPKQGLVSRADVDGDIISIGLTKDIEGVKLFMQGTETSGTKHGIEKSVATLTPGLEHSFLASFYNGVWTLCINGKIDTVNKDYAILRNSGGDCIVGGADGNGFTGSIRNLVVTNKNISFEDYLTELTRFRVPLHLSNRSKSELSDKDSLVFSTFDGVSDTSGNDVPIQSNTNVGSYIRSKGFLDNVSFDSAEDILNQDVNGTGEFSIVTTLDIDYIPTKCGIYTEGEMALDITATYISLCLPNTPPPGVDMQYETIFKLPILFDTLGKIRIVITGKDDMVFIYINGNLLGSAEYIIRNELNNVKSINHFLKDGVNRYTSELSMHALLLYKKHVDELWIKDDYKQQSKYW